MTEFFTRHGVLHAGAYTETEKGPVFVRMRMCARCGGAGGSSKWAATGWTCYDCAGSGTRGTETVRLFTAEKLAKLNATAAKKAAKVAAARHAEAAALAVEVEARRAAFDAEHGALIAAAEPYAEHSPFVADVVRRAKERASLTEAQAAALRTTVEKIAAGIARRNASVYIGDIGERIETEVTVERSATFPSSFGGNFHIVTMRTPTGATLVSKGKFLAENGEVLTIRGTVKEHSEYRDERQTLLTRVAVVAGPDAEVALNQWGKPL